MIGNFVKILELLGDRLEVCLSVLIDKIIFTFYAQKLLVSRSINMISGEEQMRAKGYDKTPDVKLEVPIGRSKHMV